MSMIQFGARKGPNLDAKNVFQSSRVAGAQIFVPSGQLSFSPFFLTSIQFSHFNKTPVEYCPVSLSLWQVQFGGLPAFGCVLIMDFHGGGAVVTFFLGALAVWQ
jgi:hypothetical protein